MKPRSRHRHEPRDLPPRLSQRCRRGADRSASWRRRGSRRGACQPARSRRSGARLLPAGAHRHARQPSRLLRGRPSAARREGVARSGDRHARVLRSRGRRRRHQRPGGGALLSRRRRTARARFSILDNHDDFGGHAKRNEFKHGDRMLVLNGGTLNIEGPGQYSPQAMGLLQDDRHRHRAVRAARRPSDRAASHAARPAQRRLVQQGTLQRRSAGRRHAGARRRGRRLAASSSRRRRSPSRRRKTSRASKATISPITCPACPRTTRSRSSFT